MNNKILYGLFLVALSTLALVGCDRSTDWNAERKSTNGLAFIKFLHAAPSFRAITNQRDSFSIFVRNDRINSNFVTYSGSAGPLQPSGAAYVATFPGAVPIRFTLGTATNPDTSTIYSTTRNLEAGKYYSFIVTDSFRSTDPAKQIFLEDPLFLPGPTQFAARFVHAVLNDTAGRTVDVFSSRLRTNMFSNVAIGTATGFIVFPQYNTPSTTDTIIVRRSGTTQELARINTETLLGQKTYTYVYRGNTTIAPAPGNTNVRTRTLTRHTNQ